MVVEGSTTEQALAESMPEDVDDLLEHFTWLQLMDTSPL